MTCDSPLLRSAGMCPFPQALQFLVVAVAGWINQQQRDVIDYLQEENRVLREHIPARRLRFTDGRSGGAWRQRPRLSVAARSVSLRRWSPPIPCSAWHRRLIARQYDGSHRRGPGRPRVMAEIRQLIVRMATENRDWGYTRIRGALSNLGHDVSRGAIATVLREHGLEPAPERTKRTTWRECLAAHWDVMAAADFFTVEVWLPRGLTRFTVLVLIELATRRVEIAGITADPDGPWVTQLARNATDAEDGFLRGRRFLIHDRDPLFTDAGRDTLAAAGVTPVRLPARSPNLNAFAERFVRTIKESCVERFVLIGERSLRRAVFEFVAHDHHERNHQGLDNQLILPPATPGRPHGPIRCRHRLGGMLKYYDRPAPDQQPMRPRRHRCSCGVLLVPLATANEAIHLVSAAAPPNQRPPTPDIRRQRRPSASRSSNWTLRPGG